MAIELAMTNPIGLVTMNDIVTTANVIMTSLVVWRQREKDEQIKNRDDTINWLKQQLKECRESKT